jgi:hypothetical protein
MLYKILTQKDKVFIDNDKLNIAIFQLIRYISDAVLYNEAEG